MSGVYFRPVHVEMVVVEEVFRPIDIIWVVRIIDERDVVPGAEFPDDGFPAALEIGAAAEIFRRDHDPQFGSRLAAGCMDVLKTLQFARIDLRDGTGPVG